MKPALRLAASSSRQPLPIRRASIYLLLGFLVSFACGTLVATGFGIPLVGLAAFAAAAYMASRTSWAPAWGIVPALLLPLPAMKTQSAYGIPLPYWLGAASLSYSSWLFVTMPRRQISWPAIGSIGTLTIAAILGLTLDNLPVPSSLTFSCISMSAAGLMLGLISIDAERTSRAVGWILLPIAILAIAEQLGVRNYAASLTNAHAFNTVASGDGTVRAYSTLGHPLVAGMILMTGALLQVNQVNSTAKFLLAPLLLAGSAATVSRTAAIGLILGILTILVMRGGNRRQLIAIALAGTALIWIALVSIPEFQQSVSTRSAIPTIHSESVRADAVERLETDLSTKPQSLLLGLGIGGISERLTSLGVPEGSNLFDNQYITGIYDLGIISFLVLISLIVLALAKGDIDSRRIVLPALVGSAGMLAFFEGLYWPTIAIVVWMLIGICSKPAPLPLVRRSPCTRALSD